MAATGTATLDFGSAPGTNFTTTTVTGQSSIASGSFVEAFMMSATTGTHNAIEHQMVPIRMVCGNISPGVGFDIIATTELRLTGQFSVKWVWN